ncbi:DUF3159 domain-containing protein [Arthrobacter sp. H14-L1]|uniref:DUF3159 domain-containing protein n=1 Tax=Arthrobacter sp. H14-L1 TaxID=2996697 RepID=UPI00226DE5F6|nr:DUF3159 domain-containing protein [Arthrobacter sp. H14-L1]MCY0904303.1 DUF3159 domain-containing protein [Arthrobacter sp. H14-L1]
MTIPDDGLPQKPGGPPDLQANPTLASVAQEMAAKSGLKRKDDGQIDLLQAAGGWRGIAESVLPGLLFVVVFTITSELNISLILSLLVALVFTGARLLKKEPLTQAIGGLIGVGISALISRSTGQAKDYYLPGFFTNAAYMAAMVISILVKWPIMGVVFGYVRNEGLRWRRDPSRLRAYRVATWMLVAVMGLRLAVQIPLYLADQVAALGSTRLIMGLPLYAFGLWLAWLLSRPVRTKDLAVDAASPGTAGP